MMKGFVPGNINVPLNQTLAGTDAHTQLKWHTHTHHITDYSYTLFICWPRPIVVNLCWQHKWKWTHPYIHNLTEICEMNTTQLLKLHHLTSILIQMDISIYESRGTFSILDNVDAWAASVAVHRQLFLLTLFFSFFNSENWNLCEMPGSAIRKNCITCNYETSKMYPWRSLSNIDKFTFVFCWWQVLVTLFCDALDNGRFVFYNSIVQQAVNQQGQWASGDGDGQCVIICY